MTEETTIEVYKSRVSRPSQRWRWRLRHRNSRLVATSGEGYTDRAEATHQARRVVTGEYAKATVVVKG